MLKIIWLTWSLTTAADLTSTHIALSRPGVVEVNPMLQSPATRDVIVGSESALGAFACQKLRRDHPRWAIGLTIAAGGFHTWATIHNLQQGRH